MEDEKPQPGVSPRGIERRSKVPAAGKVREGLSGPDTAGKLLRDAKNLAPPVCKRDVLVLFIVSPNFFSCRPTEISDSRN